MNELQIHTFAELHEIIETYDARTVIYRGMKSVKYPLIPNHVRSLLRGTLNRYGVDRFALFLNLDRLSAAHRMAAIEEGLRSREIPQSIEIRERFITGP